MYDRIVFSLMELGASLGTREIDPLVSDLRVSSGRELRRFSFSLFAFRANFEINDNRMLIYVLTRTKSASADSSSHIH